jgi:hypothetical protein
MEANVTQRHGLPLGIGPAAGTLVLLLQHESAGKPYIDATRRCVSKKNLDLEELNEPSCWECHADCRSWQNPRTAPAIC